MNVQQQNNAEIASADNSGKECCRLGVSIVICTYNGASRLPQTLAHLAAQKDTVDLAWEVIVVDNASTDGTAEVARRCWPPDAPAPMRIVHEPRPGIANARARGLAEARYEIVGFVDDDNWVADDWVGVASEIMSRDFDLGALGSLSYPVCEIEQPAWFEQFKLHYAILANEDILRIGDPPAALFGAGLAVRKAAWVQLVREGFTFSEVGAVGAGLGRGEDNELSYALREAGWKLCVDPRLRIEHFLPARRLNWTYLRRLAREGTASLILLDGYHSFDARDCPMMARLRVTWTWQVAVAVKQILQRPRAFLFAPFCAMEGDPTVLEYESWVGRLKGLLAMRASYATVMDSLRKRGWKKTPAAPHHD